jgi:ABC-type transport system substrate-binding protein
VEAGAGWHPGEGTGSGSRAFYGAPPPLEPDTAVEIQAVARKVGIELKVETITFARNQQLVFDNTFDMLPVRWIQADPMALENLFHSSNIPAPGKYRYNWMQLNDPKLDALFAEGRATTDAGEAQRDLWRGAEDHHGQRAVVPGA